MYLIKIPKHIKVSGFDYKIRTSQRINAELKAQGLRGSHAEALREIDIHTDAPPQDLSNTFMHEIIHAINTVYAHCNLTEEHVDNVTNGIHQVLEQLKVRFVL